MAGMSDTIRELVKDIRETGRLKVPAPQVSQESNEPPLSVAERIDEMRAELNVATFKHRVAALESIIKYHKRKSDDRRIAYFGKEW